MDDVKNPVQIRSKPGIQKDGTMIDSESYTDGEWVRFLNDKPKKIGGYRWISTTFAETPRLLKNYFRNNLLNIVVFNKAGAELYSYDKNVFLISGGSNLLNIGSPDDNADWSSTSLYDVISGKTVLIAILTYDLDDIANDDAGVFYKGADMSALSSLTVEEASSVSGGCCVIGQFLFLYGSEGLIMNSDLNKPFDFTVGGGSYANTVYMGDGSKVIYGSSIKGGASPAGLFWSLNSVFKITFTGGATRWSYSTLTNEITTISKKAFVEYDGVFYWPGVDRFYYANASSVQELPNQFNSEYFFNNLNNKYSSKVWGTKIPRYGEIWWFYPSGNSTECDRAVIFNIRGKNWFDIPISRTCGLSPLGTPYPIWADQNRLYLQEFGLNEVTNVTELAIRSSFTTSTQDFLTSSEQSTNINTNVYRLEPDFDQRGSMTFSILSRRYANSDDEIYESKTFDESTEKIDVRVQGRIIRFKFESNELDGDYWMGEPLVHLSGGDTRS